MRLAMGIMDLIIRISGYFLIAFILSSPVVSQFLAYFLVMLVFTLPIVLLFSGLVKVAKHFALKKKSADPLDKC